MTRKKAMRAKGSRTHQARRAVYRDKPSPVCLMEKLESRELLSSFQPIGVNFQWTNRGSTAHEIQFDAAGHCVRVVRPQVAGSNDCSLGQFGTAPDHIVVSFSSTINKKSVSV